MPSNTDIKYTYDFFERISSKSVEGIFNTSYNYHVDPVTGNATDLVSNIMMYDYEDYWHNPFEYTYDNLGNISTVSRFGILRQSFVYDELGQLTRENNKDADRTYLYSYDPNGNITMTREYPYTTGSLNSSLLLDVSEYFYDDNDWGDKLTNLNGINISYDAIGNPLNWRDAWSLYWTGRQLTEYIPATGNNNAIEFTYNSAGIRTNKKVEYSLIGGSPAYHNIEYILDGSRIIKEISSLSISPHTTNTIYYYYDDTGSVIGFNYDGADYYYGKNLQGDIVSIYSSNKVEVVQYRYDAWGNIISMTGSLANTVGRANPFRYRGYYYDTETGWYYLNSRYYDPVVGRFISADGIIGANGGIQGYNMFAYCNNNPVIFADPSGYYCALVSYMRTSYESYHAKDNFDFDIDRQIPICDPNFLGGVTIQDLMTAVETLEFKVIRGVLKQYESFARAGFTSYAGNSGTIEVGIGVTIGSTTIAYSVSYDKETRFNHGVSVNTSLSSVLEFELSVKAFATVTDSPNLNRANNIFTPVSSVSYNFNCFDIGVEHNRIISGHNTYNSYTGFISVGISVGIFVDSSGLSYNGDINWSHK